MNKGANRLFITSLFIIAAVVAQAQSSQSTRIGFVDSYMFQQPGTGVTKLLAMYQAIDKEFKPKMDELTTIQTNLDKLSREVQSGGISPAEKEKKIELHEKLRRDLQFKSEDYKSRYERRHNEMMKPLQTSMFTYLQQWSREKGFTALIDVSKDTGGFVLFVDEAAVEATTKDLIRFLNSKL